MLKVKVGKENNVITTIKFNGHALYDDYGKDIVCSAASSIVTTTVNGILSLNKGSLSYMISKQGMDIKISGMDSTTQILIQNMINLLQELENNYSNNIQVK